MINNYFPLPYQLSLFLKLRQWMDLEHFLLPHPGFEVILAAIERDSILQSNGVAGRTGRALATVVLGIIPRKKY